MTQSMSRVSRCIDNGPMEAFWGMLKTKMYYLKTFASYEELKQAVIDYTVGDSVLHPTFGVGIVTNMTRMANDVLVEIAFEKAGTKKVMANFAKLKKA